MRAVLIGAGSLTVMTARDLLTRGYEVVIVERNRERIEALGGEIDCGLLHGDGTRPAILREIRAAKKDVLFCLTGSDETNILASLVGRSLGFERVVTKIDDPEFEHMCIELGLTDTIIPARTTGRHLADMFEGRDPLELSTMVRGEARAVSFVIGPEDEGPLEGLELPEDCRIACVYRDGQLWIPGGGNQLAENDEIVVIAHRDKVDAIKRRRTVK